MVFFLVFTSKLTAHRGEEEKKTPPRVVSVEFACFASSPLYHNPGAGQCEDKVDLGVHVL